MLCDIGGTIREHLQLKWKIIQKNMKKAIKLFEYKNESLDCVEKAIANGDIVDWVSSNK